MRENTLINQSEERVVEKSNIYQKIEQKGHEDANAIIEAGKIRAHQMFENMMQIAMQDIQKNQSKAKAVQDARLQAANTQFDYAVRQNSLKAKKDLIDQVFERVIAKFKAFNDEGIKNFVTSRIALEKLSGNEKIKVSSNDYGRFSYLFSSGKTLNGNILLDKLNMLIGKPHYQLTLSKEAAHIKGGFQIIGDHFDIDFSYDALIEDLKRLYETELASILFEEGE